MRIAILDLGTNTFHLLIVDLLKNAAIRTVFKSKRSVKLGEGSIHRNYIDTIPFRRGLQAIRSYHTIIRRYKAEKITAYATSAIRSATNGNLFVNKVFQVTGIRIKIISGMREAELIYHGVRQCVDLAGAPSLIVDIGGGSTEFIIASSKKILWKQSFNIGAARLLDTIRPSDPIQESEVKRMEKLLDKTLKPLKEVIQKYPVYKLIGSSGSFDTLAEMIGWRYHDENVMKNAISYCFNLKDYYRLHDILLASSSKERMRMKGLIRMRLDMIVPASICTNYILNKFHLKEMMLSTYALKEGALYQEIKKLRKVGFRNA